MEFRKNRMEPWTLTVGNRQTRRFWKRRFAMMGQPVRPSRLGPMLPVLMLIIIAMPILDLSTTAVTADESTQLEQKQDLTTRSRTVANGKEFKKLYREVLGRTYPSETSRDRLTLVAGRKRIHTSTTKLQLSTKDYDNFHIAQLTDNTLEILARKSGVFQAKSGDRDITVVVVVDHTALKSQLTEAGYDDVNVSPAVHGVVLTGVVDKGSDRDRCIRLAEEQFASVIDQLDVQHIESQVLVDCEMLELTAGDVTTNENTINTFVEKHFAGRSLDEGVGGILASDDEFEEFRDGMSNVGKVTVKSRPQLITISGRAAHIFIGSEKPIMVPNGNKVEIRYQKIGTQIEIVPVVTEKDRLTLQCIPRITELVDGVQVDGVDVPGIRSSFQTASVELKSDQRLVSVMKIFKPKDESAPQRYLITIAKPTIITPQQSAKLADTAPVPRPINTKRR